jgi:hypothetical protein
MSKINIVNPKIAFLSFLTKIAVVVLGFGLLFNRYQAVSLLIQSEELVLTQSLFWLSLMSPIFWIELLAPICLLTALFHAAIVFDRLAIGQGFSPCMIKGLKEIGSNLTFASVAVLVIQPTLILWVKMSQFKGPHFTLDLTFVTLGMIGMVLYFLAIEGEKAQNELSGIV